MRHNIHITYLLIKAQTVCPIQVCSGYHSCWLSKPSHFTGHVLSVRVTDGWTNFAMTSCFLVSEWFIIVMLFDWGNIELMMTVCRVGRGSERGSWLGRWQCLRRWQHCTQHHCMFTHYTSMRCRAWRRRIAWNHRCRLKQRVKYLIATLRCNNNNNNNIL